MTELDAGGLVLRPVTREQAIALLDGRTPDGLLLAAGYPSRFSLEVMQFVVSTPEQDRGFGPWFMHRKPDGAVVGEIGANLAPASATAQTGYTVVEPSWGRGHATDALRALLTHVLADPRVRRVMAETPATHAASRRVMEKAGMTLCGERTGDVDGETMELVIYEALATPG
jgi:RimJ/RimL family protein N-acetyltransferase